MAASDNRESHFMICTLYRTVLDRARDIEQYRSCVIVYIIICLNDCVCARLKNQLRNGLDTLLLFSRCDALCSVRIGANGCTGCRGSRIDNETDMVFDIILDPSLLRSKLVLTWIRIIGIDSLSIDNDVLNNGNANADLQILIVEINIGFISSSNRLCCRSMTICAVDLIIPGYKHAPNVIFAMRINFRLVFIAALNNLVMADRKVDSLQHLSQCKLALSII